MALTGAQLVTKIAVESDAEAKAKIESVGQAVDKTSAKAKEGGFSIGGMFKQALSFAGGQAIFAGLDFLKNQIGHIFQQSTDAQAGLAQTNQVIKSTGGVAGVTAQAVLDLATQYSHLTQFSDDTVQSASNMLLTFTNIGKNVFPQATKTVLDMSQALGQDTKNSAIQLGKALNDPITGVSALQRVGVTFTQGQKDAIKAMMDTGNMAGAQGVILKELGKEFGGSAEAAGKTFPGQLKILGQNFDDLKQTIGDAVMPILSKLIGWITGSVVPALQKFGDWFAANGIPVLQRFGGWIQQNVLPILLKMGQWFVKDAVPALQKFGGVIQTQVIPVIQNIGDIIGIVLGWIRDHWTQIWGILGPYLQGVWNVISGIIKVAWALVSGIIRIGLDILQGKWGKVWTDIKSMLGGVLDGIGTIVHGFIGMFGAAFSGLGTLLHGIWDGIVGVIKGAINLIMGAIIGFIDFIDC